MKQRERTDDEWQILYEYQPSPQAERRVATAYEMIFAKIEEMMKDKYEQTR